MQSYKKQRFILTELLGIFGHLLMR